MVLSVCSNDQYTCDDGQCISLSERCNLKVDCDDRSDENDCSLLSIPSGYSITIPPPPIVPEKPLLLNISVDILSFPIIKTQNLLYETNMKLTLTWNDIRLNYFNLKSESTLNFLNPDDVTRIWTPVLFFRNAKGNLFSNLNQGSRVECLITQEPVRGGKHLSYEGEQSSITVINFVLIVIDNGYHLVFVHRE